MYNLMKPKHHTEKRKSYKPPKANDVLLINTKTLCKKH